MDPIDRSEGERVTSPLAGEPSGVLERIARLEAELAALKATLEKRNEIERISTSVDALAAASSTLVERVLAVEGLLKRIPTLRTIVLCQLGMGIVIACLVVLAVRFGTDSAKLQPTPPPNASSKPWLCRNAGIC